MLWNNNKDIFVFYIYKQLNQIFQTRILESWQGFESSIRFPSVYLFLNKIKIRHMTCRGRTRQGQGRAWESRWSLKNVVNGVSSSLKSRHRLSANQLGLIDSSGFHHFTIFITLFITTTIYLSTHEASRPNLALQLATPTLMSTFSPTFFPSFLNHWSTPQIILDIKFELVTYIIKSILIIYISITFKHIFKVPLQKHIFSLFF